MTASKLGASLGATGPLSPTAKRSDVILRRSASAFRRGAFQSPERRQDQYVWERDDSVWVMGAIGGKLLRKVDGVGAGTDSTASHARQHHARQRRSAASVNTDVNTDHSDDIGWAYRCATAPAKQEDFSPNAILAVEVPAVARRPRCQAMEGEGDAKCGCLCAKYDPLLALPLLLFDRVEMAKEVIVCARSLLQREDAKKQLQLYHGATPAMFQPLYELTTYRGTAHFLLRYKLRDQGKQVALDHLRGATDFEAVARQLDILEYAVNARLLPALHRWCEEYLAIKAARAAQEAKEAQAAKEKAVLERVAAIGQQQEQQPKPGNAVPEITMYPGPFKGAAGATAGTTSAPRLQMPKIPLGLRPAVCCKCGHGEAWHRKPREDLPSEEAEPLAGGLLLPTERAKTPKSPGRKTQRQAPTFSLMGGRLVLSQAGASSLGASKSSPLLPQKPA